MHVSWRFSWHLVGDIETEQLWRHNWLDVPQCPQSKGPQHCSPLTMLQSWSPPHTLPTAFLCLIKGTKLSFRLLCEPSLSKVSRKDASLSPICLESPACISPHPKHGHLTPFSFHFQMETEHIPVTRMCLDVLCHSLNGGCEQKTLLICQHLIQGSYHVWQNQFRWFITCMAHSTHILH